MTERPSSAADAGANELSRDGYLAMLAEGLNEDAAAAARAEWSALASLVEPLFDEFADGLMAGTRTAPQELQCQKGITVWKGHYRR